MVQNHLIQWSQIVSTKSNLMDTFKSILISLVTTKSLNNMLIFFKIWKAQNRAKFLEETKGFFYLVVDCLL
jgi:hypothetical protein